MARLIDLSHPLYDGMPVYPGFPKPRFGAHLTHEQSRPHYQGQAEFHISRYDMVGSLGSYMDSPFHRYPEGIDLSQIPLDRVAHLPGLAIDARRQTGRPLGPQLLEGIRALRGKAVLFRTDWSERWEEDSYWEPAPFLSGELCRLLIERGIVLVGVDFWNVDDTADPSRPAHTVLLAAGVLIVENMAKLGALPPMGFHLHAAPLAIRGGAVVPLRAYAVVG
ncbi:MAG: cyclase family protein [Chloroflexota bacterium]